MSHGRAGPHQPGTSHHASQGTGQPGIALGIWHLLGDGDRLRPSLDIRGWTLAHGVRARSLAWFGSNGHLGRPWPKVADKGRGWPVIAAFSTWLCLAIYPVLAARVRHPMALATVLPSLTVFWYF